jgi:hypothetical protein
MSPIAAWAGSDITVAPSVAIEAPSAFGGSSDKRAGRCADGAPNERAADIVRNRAPDCGAADAADHGASLRLGAARERCNRNHRHDGVTHFCAPSKVINGHQPTGKQICSEKWRGAARVAEADIGAQAQVRR